MSSASIHTDNTDGNLPNLPDDIIFLILLRCPLKSIFRFKGVCKTWDENLSNPSFRDTYIAIQDELQVPQPLLGFFNFDINHPGKMKLHSDEEIGPPGFSFLPTNIELEGEPLTRFGFDSVNKVGSFLGISNGLLLFGDHPNFHVFNPITRQLFSLPRACVDIKSINSNNHLLIDYHAGCPGFFSSESDSNFKVTVPYVNQYSELFGETFVLVELYSSKTGLWKESKLVAAKSFHLDTVVMPASIGGTFLWLSHRNNFKYSLMVYDTDRADIVCC